MLILALDTTTRTGSCALVRDAETVQDELSDPLRSPAARLPTDLIELLARVDVPLDAIDLYAVATGPGSFTGLRIGIATMQGLAMAAGKPLLGISSLDALAYLGGRAASRAFADPAPHDDTRVERTLVATWVDAWRGEIYAALYDQGESTGATVAHPDKVLAEYEAVLDGASSPTRILFIGDAAVTYREVILSRLGEGAAIADPPAPSLAGVIGRLAWQAALRGDRPAPHAIRALYVRRPDVEMKRDRA